MAARAVQYVVRGRVQGVGYRFFARNSATKLGLAGFVRNLADGSVEVFAEGDEEQLTSLEQALRAGPSFAQVDSVAGTPATPRGESCFQIR